MLSAPSLRNACFDRGAPAVLAPRRLGVAVLRTADDQPVARARHRDIKQAPMLAQHPRLVRRARLRSRRVIIAFALEEMNGPFSSSNMRPSRAVSFAVAGAIRQDDHRRFKPLGAVHGHHPDRRRFPLPVRASPARRRFRSRTGSAAASARQTAAGFSARCNNSSSGSRVSGPSRANTQRPAGRPAVMRRLQRPAQKRKRIGAARARLSSRTNACACCVFRIARSPSAAHQRLALAAPISERENIGIVVTRARTKAPSARTPATDRRRDRARRASAPGNPRTASSSRNTMRSAPATGRPARLNALISSRNIAPRVRTSASTSPGAHRAQRARLLVPYRFARLDHRLHALGDASWPAWRVHCVAGFHIHRRVPRLRRRDHRPHRAIGHTSTHAMLVARARRGGRFHHACPARPATSGLSCECRVDGAQEFPATSGTTFRNSGATNVCFGAMRALGQLLRFAQEAVGIGALEA